MTAGFLGLGYGLDWVLVDAWADAAAILLVLLCLYFYKENGGQCMISKDLLLMV
jgi:hypothetical protein